MISLNIEKTLGFISKENVFAYEAQVKAAQEALENGTGKGNDFLGWVNLPVNYDKEEFARIKAAAAKIRKDTDILIVIGIGGSYLGARAAIEFLKGPFYNQLKGEGPEIYFAGNSISGAYLSDIVKLCEGKRVSVNIISKSGTTTAPAVPFRVLRGTLKKLADEKGYECFVVPDDVGGRFSVLTAVGLLPIAAAGADIDALISGAAAAMKDYNEPDIYKNDCY